MIKFFKKIRQNLLSEGKTVKYVKYAIGEIVLVVIGILIALSINNWNENRKDRQLESKILEELTRTLNKNTALLEQKIAEIMDYQKSTVKILNVVEKKLPYDSLSSDFHKLRVGTFINLVTSGYENLKNTGFEIIESDSLKNEIIDLFESTYPELLENVDEIPLYESEFQTYLRMNFTTNETLHYYQPLSQDRIFHDNFYYESLMHITGVRSWHLELLKNSLEESRKIQKLIQTELKTSN